MPRTQEGKTVAQVKKTMASFQIKLQAAQAQVLVFQAEEDMQADAWQVKFDDVNDDITKSLRSIEALTRMANVASQEQDRGRKAIQLKTLLDGFEGPMRQDGARGGGTRSAAADALHAKTVLLIEVVAAKSEALNAPLRKAMASVDGLLQKLEKLRATAETSGLQAQLQEVKVRLQAVLTENQEDLQREVAAATAERDRNRKRERAEALEPALEAVKFAVAQVLQAKFELHAKARAVQIKTLKTRLKAAKAATAEINLSKSAEINLLKDQLEAAEAATAEINLLKDQLEAAEAATAEINLLKDQLEAAEAATAEINLLKDQLEAAKAATAEINLLKSAEIDLLKDQLEAAEAATAEINRLKDKLEAAKAATAEINLSKSAEINLLKDQLEAAEAATAEIDLLKSAEIDRLMDKLEAAKAATAEIDLSKSAKIKTLQDQLKAAHHTIKELLQEKVELQSKVAALEDAGEINGDIVMTIDQLAAFDVDKKKGKPGFHLANGPAMLSNLYRVIESGDYTEFIWWMKDGQAFKIKNKKSFQKEVLQKCNVSDIASSNWFSGISRSGLRRFLKEGNAYYHPKGYFVKGRPELCPLGHMEKRNLNQALDIWNKTLKEGKYYEGKKLPMPLKPGKD
jgi:hypothetical protein